jgi:hypothetical protein
LEAMVFQCTPRPVRLSYETDENFRRRSDKWLACRECDKSRTRLTNNHETVLEFDKTLKEAEEDLDELKRELELKKEQLRYWKSKEAEIRKNKLDQEANWLPQKESCEAKYIEAKRERIRHIGECGPKHYDESCEKRCIEAQNEGCGVLEGSKPNSNLLHGGVRATCSPPHPSWIRGPWNWDVAEESTFKQCRRILNNQGPVYATKILIQGFLLKKGRMNGWKQRYFAMESGNSVRSATIRYWLQNPTTDPRAEERFTKSIFVWDAKAVYRKTWGWSDNNCLGIDHWYRWIALCVPDSEGNAAAKADQWVDFINRSIKFRQT